MHRETRKRSFAARLGFALAVLVAAPALAAGPAPREARSGAKICLVCHTPERGNLLGNWESVAMKSSSILLNVDDRSEVFLFDKATLQVLNAPVENDVEKMLRSLKSGQEIRVGYIARNGGKYATVVAAMPAVKLPAREEIALARLSAAMRKTTKLVNALQKVVLPRIEHDIRAIVDGIEEDERDDAIRRRVAMTRPAGGR